LLQAFHIVTNKNAENEDIQRYDYHDTFVLEDRGLQLICCHWFEVKQHYERAQALQEEISDHASNVIVNSEQIEVHDQRLVFFAYKPTLIKEDQVRVLLIHLLPIGLNVGLFIQI